MPLQEHGGRTFPGIQESRSMLARTRCAWSSGEEPSWCCTGLIRCHCCHLETNEVGPWRPGAPNLSKTRVPRSPREPGDGATRRSKATRCPAGALVSSAMRVVMCVWMGGGGRAGYASALACICALRSHWCFPVRVSWGVCFGGSSLSFPSVIHSHEDPPVGPVDVSLMPPQPGPCAL